MSEAYCRLAPGHSVHASYHEREYGFPSAEESVLFERLVLEITQAGLSWLTVLKKRAALRAAFADWDVDHVAAFGAEELERLLADRAIVRNRLKLAAAIENARRIKALRKERGSFYLWLEAHHPRSLEAWTVLFRKTFLFTGKTIAEEFLLSLGYLEGAHEPFCPVYARILALSPPWLKARPSESL